MPLEAVEDRLPAAALHLFRIVGLGVEGHADSGACGVGQEVDGGRAVAEGIGDVPVRLYRRVGPREIEAETAVLRLHPGRKGTARTQVDLGPGGVPVIRGDVPLHDVGRRNIGVPDAGDGGGDMGFDGDGHGGPVGLKWHKDIPIRRDYGRRGSEATSSPPSECKATPLALSPMAAWQASSATLACASPKVWRPKCPQAARIS
jgi:hypothetical protein